jgi:hypothetical protein
VRRPRLAVRAERTATQSMVPRAAGGLCDARHARPCR